MREITCEVIGGKVYYNGRTLAEWVPVVVSDLVAAANPLQVILFGSVARGDDGPDSDIDVVVVLPKVDRAQRAELMGKFRIAIHAPVPIDVFVTDAEEIEREKNLIGSFLYWPAREGRVLYEQAA